MKVINLSVNIEDNKLLDKSIKDAMDAYAKQIARESVEKAITAEIDRIIGIKLAELSTGSYQYSAVENKITEKVAERMGAKIEFDSDKIKELIESIVNKKLDSQIDCSGGVEQYMQKLINRSLAGMLLNNK